MLRKGFLPILVSLILIGSGLAGVHPTAKAFSGLTIVRVDYYDPEPTICDWFFAGIYFTGIADTVDLNGGDLIAFTVVDANGVVLDTDFLWFNLGPVTSNGFTVETGYPGSPTARPFTVSAYDIPDYGSIDEDTLEGYEFATSGTLLDTFVFDPSDYTENGVCDELPYGPTQPSAPGTASERPAFRDGRINTDPGQEASIWCRSNGIDIWYGSKQHLFVSQAEIDEVGVTGENTLIAQDQWVSLYRLSNGWFQVNVTLTDVPGKVYGVRWDKCPNPNVVQPFEFYPGR